MSDLGGSFSGKAIPLSKAGIYVAPAAANIDNKNTSDQADDPLLGLFKDTEPLPTALAQRGREVPQECFIETPCTRPCGDGFKLLLPNPKGIGQIAQPAMNAKFSKQRFFWHSHENYVGCQNDINDTSHQAICDVAVGPRIDLRCSGNAASRNPKPNLPPPRVRN